MAGNSTPIKRFYPPGSPASDPLAHLYQLFYELESREGNTGNLASNTASNFAAFLASQNTAGGGGGGNAAVQFGNHTARVGSGALLYIETDRNNAVYGNNGAGWGLVEATWVGPFENRYGDLGLNDTGAFWIETSRNSIAAVSPLLQFRWNGTNWAYEQGQISRNQNQLTALFGTLGTPDANLQINVLDYRHQLQWQGSNTTWGPNDDGRAGEGPIFREIDPSPATGWHLYDGSSVNYLNANGATSSVTLPDLTSSSAAAAYLKGGSPNSGPNNPVAPIFTGNNATGNVTINPFNPSGSIVSLFVGDAGTTGTQNSSGTTNAGNTLNVALAPHTHQFTPTGNVTSSFFGNPITPTANFTGDPVTGTISNNGQPRNLERRPWFRQ